MSAYLGIDGLTAMIGDAPVLRDVSLRVQEGAVHGLVGESGAGKSMIGKAVLGILPSAVHVTAGEIWLGGENLLAMKPKDRRRYVGARAALIPQDPLTALNPAKRIGRQITDRLTDLLGWDKTRARDRAGALLEEVHIPDPTRVLASYPHQLSGGMRQRVLIAAAFAAEPKLIMADEPTTALDVTVQRQILRLIRALQSDHSTAMLFVTHDLGVVSKVCGTLSILYAGRILEETDTTRFFDAPGHAYAQALLAATPKYTDPDYQLHPVPEAVITGVEAEIAAWDKAHGLG